jgi:tetratricopeptide (TPR) repeat protein
MISDKLELSDKPYRSKMALTSKVKTSAQKHSRILICLFLAIAVVSVYGQMLGHDFVYYDDHQYAADNAHVKAGLTVEGLKWAFTTLYVEFWHPLTWLSLMLDTQLFGVAAGGYLFSNLLLHILNALLLFIFFNRSTGSVWQSGLVAALFALHPIHVESVAWIAQRKDVLSTFFWMLTLLCYGFYVERPGPKRYLGVILALILGLMAKPMLITLPLVLLLLDYWPLGRFRTATSLNSFLNSALIFLREKIPLLAVSGAAGVITYLAQQSGGGIKSVASVSLAERISNALISYVGYIVNMLWPFKLACYYPFPDSFSLWRVGGSFLLLLLITWFAVRSARRHPFFIVGWLWYLGTLVPVIGLVKIGAFAMADRYGYGPLIGIYVLVAWGLPELTARLPHRRAIINSLAALALIICMVTTWHQVRFWQNKFTLFTRALNVTSNNWFAHNALGLDFLKREKFDEALNQFSKAMQIVPNYITTYINIGIMYARQNNLSEAIRYMSTAERMNPDLAEVQQSLGVLYEQHGNPGKALAHFRRALVLDPENAIAHKHMGNLMVAGGKIDEAIDHYARSLTLQPGDAGVHYNLGLAFEKQGNDQKAGEQYLAALKITPDEANTHYNLANVMTRQKKFDAAIEHYQKALAIQPDYIPALSNLAYVHASKKEYDRSIAILFQMADLQPDNPGIYYNLAGLFALQNKTTESIQWLAAAFKKGYQNCQGARTDEDLRSIRTSPGYRDLMKRYCR